MSNALVIEKFIALFPEIIIAVFSLFIILIDLFIENKKALHYISLSGFFLAFFALISVFNTKEEIWNGILVVDPFSQFFKIIFLLAAILVVITAMHTGEIKEFGEYYALLFLATLGMLLVASSGELITLYVSLELATLSTFALAVYSGKKEAAEGGFKYFVIGALSSAIIAFGFSFLYGLTGETKLALISDKLPLAMSNFSELIVLAIVLIIAGFGFEIAAVPFHMWVPDAYQGSPSSTTILLATAIETMGFAALFRIFGVSVSVFKDVYLAIFIALSFITMVYGNIAALAQKNVKRILAYSSIGHAGFVLIGFALFTPLGIAASSLHLLAYLFMNAGAFAIAGYFASKFEAHDYEDYSGIRELAPVSSFFLLIFLFSLAGIPPLAGFLSKVVLFAAAIQGNLAWLAAVAVVMSAVSVYYYVRILKYVYLEDIEEERRKRFKKEEPRMFLFFLFLAVLALFIIGIFPEQSISLAMKPANALLCKLNLACM